MKTFFLTLLLTIFNAVIIKAQVSELPFFDDFSNNYENWTTYSVTGDDQWHISGDDGIDGSKCARFYITSNPPQANDDWLVSKVFDTKGISNIAITFKYLFNEAGASPDYYFTKSFDGNPANSTWAQIDKNFWKNIGGWQDARIEIENPGETFVFAVRYNVSASDSYYFLMDNFKIESYTPINYTFSDSTKYFTFHSTLEDGQNYWNEISDEIDKWYLELCSYWDRPGTPFILEPDKKTEIKLIDEISFQIQKVSEFPDWKCCFFNSNGTLVTTLPSEENVVYENSYSMLVKNILGQHILNKHFNENINQYFLEAFGLYYSGFRPEKDEVLAALDNLGRMPVLSDIENINNMNNLQQKILAATYMESKVLQDSYQGLYPGNEALWQNHLTYFYQGNDESRIGLHKPSVNFDFYCIPRDTIFLDTMAQRLESLFEHYTSLFELEINNRFNVIIFPDKETANGINGGEYSIGSAHGGDNFNMLSPYWSENSMQAASGGLVAHEFWHVIHFHMRPYDGYPNGQFIMEGMADYMPVGTHNMRSEPDLWKINEVFYNYSTQFSREPTLQDIMSNPQSIEPYLFGQLFFNYLIPSVASYIDVKNFFLGRCDWSAFNVSYSDIDKGYISYLKSLANYTPKDTLVNLPFEELFNTFNNGWTTPSFTNQDNWRIDDGGTDESNCARFYTHSDKNVPIESWLISPPLDAKNMEQITLSFDFSRFGEGIELELFYTSNFVEFTDSSNWTTIKKIEMPNDWGWSNTREITITNPPDTVFIGLQMKTTGEQHQQLYIDNYMVNGILTKNKEIKLGEYNFTIYPNPITSESIISFQTKTNDKVNLAVYDIQGRKICTLLNEIRNFGYHTVPVENIFTAGGVYLCKLTTSEGVSTLKLIVNKQ